MLKKIATDKAPAAIGPYSQAIAAGDFLFASGQIPINPANGTIEAEGIEAQAEQVMKIIRPFWKSRRKLVWLRQAVSHSIMAEFCRCGSVYRNILQPARSCVAVKELPKSVLCEVEVIAYLG